MAEGSKMAEDEPLTPEQRFLLDVHQEELVTRMDLEDSLLLPLLKDREVISFTHREAIEAVPANRRCEKLLGILRKGTRQNYETFCDTLRETHHGHLVSNFLSKAAVNKRIKHLQGRLTTYFKKSYQDDMFAYHQEGYRVPLEGLYQPLQWVEHQKEYTGIDTKPLESYLDLFKQTDSEGRFIVQAEANGGKTTMLRRICRDWADQHLGGAARQGLSRFVVVIPIILRAVKQGASLVETVKQQLGLTGKDDLTVKDVKTLIYCLETGEDELCFINDGLDEYVLTKSEEVTAVMSGDLYPSSWCIITSRPEGTSCVKNWHNVLYREAELKGFSEESIRKYVRHFFSNKNPGLGQHLLQVLFPVEPLHTDFFSEGGAIEDAHVGIIELASNPGRLALICIIYAETKTLPSTKEQLSQEFVRFMLSRWEKKCESTHGKQHPRATILDHHKDILLLFGKLACETDGVKMKLVFKHEELIKHIDINLIKIGLVYRSHPVSRLVDCEYSFVHKSIQEYLAAYYLYHSQLDSTVSAEGVILEILNMIRREKDEEIKRAQYLLCIMQVWVMCDYVSLQELSLLLKDIFGQPNQWDEAGVCLLMLLRALNLTPLEQMALPEPVTVELGGERLMFQLPVYYVYQGDEDSQQLVPPDFRIFKQQDQPRCELTWPVHLQALGVNDVFNERVDKVKLDAFSKSSQRAELWYLHHLPLVLKGTSVQHLELCTAGRTDITNLDGDTESIEICNSQLRGKGAWLAHTLACLDCREISIQTCGLQQQDLQATNAYLEEHHSSLAAETLYLNKNDLSGAGRDIVKLLQHMPRLSNVDLGDSGLSEGDKETITGYFTGLKEKVEVCMEDRPDSDGAEV